MRKFIGVYYEWGHDTKGPSAEINMEKDIQKWVEGYDNSIGSDVTVQKTPGAPGTNLIHIDLE